MGAHTQGRAAQGGRERMSLWNDEAGQGMIEYALIGGIVILGAVAVLTVLSKNLGDLFTTISNTLAQY